MILLQGQGVSGGVVRGPLFFFKRNERETLNREGAGAQAEKARFKEARQAAAGQLETLAGRCRETSGEEAALLFETHALLIEDEDFNGEVHALIEKENCSAEYAVRAAGERFADMLSGMEDEYMQARAADVRDVARRLTDILTGAQEDGIAPERPVILAADDLAPSETVRLDRKMILGFITRGGSASGHTAILARTMGIPAVCGACDVLKEEYAGETAFMDGGSGRIILRPDARTLKEFEESERQQAEQEKLLEEQKGQEDVTIDGRRLMLYCNIASLQDLPAALESDAQGIGLFRSEFLYLTAKDFPDEEEQFAVYREAAEAMKGRRVIIRTLDIGADKQAGYFGMSREENPALGLRGVRVCLKRPEIFKTQLRALYRASAYGKIAIMFPMIASVWEVRECRRICREAMAELDRERIPYNRKTEIGIMIETPASVLMADELAREVDFFSVGTNDLTQYTLCCDRQLNTLGRFFDPHHPAVLRSIRKAAEAAHEAGIWIGVCGELAADQSMLSEFLDIGIDELSVAPAAVLPLRREIRRSVAGSGRTERSAKDLYCPKGADENGQSGKAPR